MDEAFKGLHLCPELQAVWKVVETRLSDHKKVEKAEAGQAAQPVYRQLKGSKGGYNSPNYNWTPQWNPQYLPASPARVEKGRATLNGINHCGHEEGAEFSSANKYYNQGSQRGRKRG